MALYLTSVPYIMLQVEKKKTPRKLRKKKKQQEQRLHTKKINECITESEQSKLFLWLLKC